MAALEPFEPAPRLAVGVSGGADSLALALLARDWAASRGGSTLGIVIDHGLRRDSSTEAAETLARLAAMGVRTELIRLGLTPGPALAERARQARYAALHEACGRAGIVHLLLGHHAADQAETVLIRTLSGSGPAGLAGMPALSEQVGVRLLRPVLAVPPARLRATLVSAGVGWVEDPSNRDSRALRPRLRALRADRSGGGAATRALCAAVSASGQSRAVMETAAAHELAAAVIIRPEGFAVLRPGSLDPAALAALIGTIAGSPYPPSPRRIAGLARVPRPATIAGVRLLPGGRFAPGLLVVREAALMAPPCEVTEQVWDGRFRLLTGARPPAGLSLGALGTDAAHLRHLSDLPAVVLYTLPAVRHGNQLFAVPHLGYPDPERCASVPLMFSPPRPVAGMLFSGAR